MDWPEFKRGFDRHVNNLGFVPPEFRDAQSFGRYEPSDRHYVCNTTPAAMRSLMPMAEWQAIEEAAELAHRIRGAGGNSSLVEFARKRGGYGKLGHESFIIPDQRPLIQGGDNDPLD